MKVSRNEIQTLFVLSVALCLRFLSGNYAVGQSDPVAISGNSRIDELNDYNWLGERQLIFPRMRAIPVNGTLLASTTGPITGDRVFSTGTLLGCRDVIEQTGLAGEELARVVMMAEKERELSYEYARAIIEFSYELKSREQLESINLSLVNKNREIARLIGPVEHQRITKWRNYIIARNYGPFLLGRESGNDKESPGSLRIKQLLEIEHRNLLTANEKVTQEWKHCLEGLLADLSSLDPEVVEQYDPNEKWLTPCWGDVAVLLAHETRILKRLVKIGKANDFEALETCGAISFGVTEQDCGEFEIEIDENEFQVIEWLKYILVRENQRWSQSGENELELTHEQAALILESMRDLNRETSFFLQTGSVVGDFVADASRKWKKRVLEELLLPSQHQFIGKIARRSFLQNLGPFGLFAECPESKLESAIERFEIRANLFREKLLAIEKELIEEDIKIARELCGNIELFRPVYLKPSVTPIVVRLQTHPVQKNNTQGYRGGSPIEKAP